MPRETSDSKHRQAKPHVARPISRRERWLIRGLLAAAVLLVTVSLAVTVGKDAVQMVVRHWEAGRMPVAEINPPPLSELPPPLPELGLPPPPAVSLTPPATTTVPTPPPGASARPAVDPPEDGAAVVVIEPVLDGHMIEPEGLDVQDQPLAEADTPDPGRNLVDELFVEAGKGNCPESGPTETAPEVVGLKTASARERIKYASAVKRVLKLLAEGHAADHDDAMKSYTEARQICREDPRLPLAFGLYLQHIGQPQAARLEFEACAENEGKSYLLIHQAAAMSRLLTKDLRRAWPHLLQLAEVVGQPAQGQYPTEWQRRRTADWLGATAAYLESLPEDTDGRHLIDPGELRTRLPDALQPLFDAGRAEAGRHLSELTKWIDLPPDELTGQLTEAISKLEVQHQTATAEVDTLKETLREATAGLREAQETEKKSRGELNLALRQRRQAQDAVADLSQPRTYSYTQTTYTYQTDSQGRRQRVPQTVVLQRPENSSERSARLAQLQEASAALAKVESVLPGMKSQHDVAKTARDELVLQVREQTADARAKLALAQRHLQHTERLLSRLQGLAANPAKLADRVHSPTLVLEWNSEEIADRLKKTFETPGKSSAKTED